MDVLAKAQHNIGNIITIPSVVNALAKSYLTTNYNAAVTSVVIDNATDFSNSSVGLIGDVGTEIAELITITTVTQPITLTTISATKFPHNVGEVVQRLEYDQFVVEKATSVSGPFSTLVTISIQVNQQETIVHDTIGLTTDFYRIRLRNSVSALSSDPSTPFSPDVYLYNSVGRMFDSVKTLYGVPENDPMITTPFMLTALNDARNSVNQRLFNFKQSWRQQFEYPIKLKAGWNYVELPADYDQQDTNAMLLSVRYPRINGVSPYPLKYIDKREWNLTAYQLKYSYSVGATLIGATSILVESVGDFNPSGGTVFVATNAFTETIMVVNYTGVNFSTNTLTGVTGVTRNFAAGTQMFGFPTFSAANLYTVFDGKIWFNRPVPDVSQGSNIYIDYYKVLTPITDINTVLPEPYGQVYDPYLRWSIKYRKDPTINPAKDVDYIDFQENIQSVVDGYYTGQYPKVIVPMGR